MSARNGLAVRSRREYTAIAPRTWLPAVASRPRRDAFVIYLRMHRETFVGRLCREAFMKDSRGFHTTSMKWVRREHVVKASQRLPLQLTNSSKAAKASRQ